MELIQTLFAKFVNYETISYLVVGVLTTILSIAVFAGCYRKLKMSTVMSNIISWVIAVAFAYLTNKPFVFKSHDWSAKVVVPELAKFIGCRIGSGVLETAIIFVTVDCLHWNGNLIKLLTSVLVVVMNYIASKLLVFRKRRGE